MLNYSASSVIQAVRAWNSASNRLGLKENEEKTSFVCFSAQQKHDLMAQGVSPHSIQSQARILGVDVMTNSNDVSQTMMGRCQKGPGILARLAFCPIGREVRRALYRSRVFSLLTWGVWMRSLPQDVVKETRRLYRCLSRGHPMGSAALRTILEGHRADPQFWALQQSVEAAVRANKYTDRCIGRFRLLNWVGKTPSRKVCMNMDGETLVLGFLSTPLKAHVASFRTRMPLTRSESLGGGGIFKNF